MLRIMTKVWIGWGKSQVTEDGNERDQKGDVGEKIRRLAKLTKGYGGADLKVCTPVSFLLSLLIMMMVGFMH